MGDVRKALVVGGGSAGRRHFRFLTEAGVACSLCDPSDACRVLGEFPDAERFPDFEKVDLATFDAVVICTPPILHVPQALRAAQAGCHILTEKPLSVLSEDGLDELENLVRDNQLVAAVSYPFASMLAIDRIIELVRAGTIGEVLSVAVHQGQNILKYHDDYSQIYYGNDAQGGGSLQDGTVHSLVGLERLLGPEEQITAQRHIVGIRGENITSDDTNWMWIRYPNNVLVSIDFSFYCHWRHYEWIIGGSTGAIQFLVNEAVVNVFDAETDKTSTERFDDSWDETFRRNDENFLSAVRGEAQVRCSIEQARVTLRAALAARRSAESGAAVRLQDL